MRSKLVSSFIVVVVIALTAIGFRSGAGAQDATTQGHPLVGTWLADTEPEDPSSGLATFVFSGDGSYVEVDSDGTVQLGAWEATGANTANVTIVSYFSDEDGANFGSATVRASGEVSADGNSFTAQYTVEFIDPDGTSMGEAGPGSVIATRLVVEAPGTPVMTLEELFSSFEGTPEATPAP